MDYKIVILGGGPGGYVAAIRAAQLGAKVALIEKEELGGTCLNRGCIPTKALVASAEIVHNLKKSQEYGITYDGMKIDFSKMMERKDQIVGRLVAGIHFLIKKNKITLFNGTGRLVSQNQLEITKSDGSREEISAENVIIATGSEPALITSLGYDGETVITSNEALTLKQIPQSILIIGGGVIGCEFACIFTELGTEVTIVDIMPSILPGVDQDIAKSMQSLFKRRKIKVKTKAKIQAILKNPGQVTAVLESGEEISAEIVLISIGRTLNSSGIGVDEVGVELGAKGEIRVDSTLKTNIPGIYAIGDVTNKIQLAHVASAQGITAVENIMGAEIEMNYDIVPSCIFTSPEVAFVGLSSQQAEKLGIPFKTGKFPLMALGKAQAAGETDGFVKIIAEPKTNKILGVHIMGSHATDLIAEATLAMQLGATVSQLAETIHAHPTIAEAMMEAAEAVNDRCIHL